MNSIEVTRNVWGFIVSVDYIERYGLLPSAGAQNIADYRMKCAYDLLSRYPDRCRGANEARAYINAHTAPQKGVNSEDGER